MYGYNIGTGGTFTINLQEYVGSTWTTRTTDTFNTNDWFPNFDNNYSPRVVNSFPLTSYTVDTTASKWRYSFTSTKSLYMMRTATAGQYFYAVTLDTAGNPGSGDTIGIANNVVLTIDENLTTGNSNYTCGFASEGSTIQSTPTAPITWTSTGQLFASATFNLYIGSASSRITDANAFTFDWTGATSGKYIIFLQDYNYGSFGEFKMYGAYSDNPKAVLASTANSGQKNLVTTADMSGVWSAGDTIVVTHAQAEISTFQYTIDSISGTTITVTTNLGHTYNAGGWIMNVSESDQYGIRILGVATGGNPMSGNSAQVNDFIVDGVYCQNIVWNISSMDTTGTKSVQFKHMLFNGLITNSNRFIMAARTQTASAAGTYVMDNVYVAIRNNNPGTCLYMYGVIPPLSVTITNSCLYGNYRCSVYLSNVVNLSISDSIIVNTQGRTTNSNYRTLYLTSCYSVRLSNVECWAGQANYFNGGGMSVTNCKFLYADYAVNLSSLVDSTFTGCDVGESVASNTYDLYVGGNTYNKVLFSNCKIGSKGVANYANAIDGGYVRLDTYDQTSNDHRSFLTYGKIQSTGDGLTDTTVHTSGTGKFALRFEPTSSTSNLEWEFDIPTGDISTKTMTVAVWCKINNANYYSGTYQLPRLTINYDNGTTAYYQAATTTDWQLLFVTFTPTTTYGQITITLSARTDATTTNAYVYWDDFAVLYPAGYKLDMGGMDLWANALPVTPPIATVLSAKDVWTAASTEDYGTNTMGNKLKQQIKLIDGGEIPIYG